MVEEVSLRNFRIKNGILVCDAVREDGSVETDVNVYAYGPIRWFPESAVTRGLLFGNRAALPLIISRMPDELSPGEWGILSPSSWGTSKRNTRVSILGLFRYFIDMVRGFVSVRIIKLKAKFPWLSINVDESINIEAKQAENLPRFGSISIMPRDLKIKMDVRHRDGSRVAWTLRVDENKIHISGDQTEVNIDQSGKILANNRNGFIEIKPDGTIIMDSGMAQSILQHAGKIVFKTVTPVTGQKVLTNKSVVCPILGVLEPFGDPTMQLTTKT